MFIQEVPTTYPKLEEAINKLLVRMLDEECDTEAYGKMADQIVKLYKAKELHSTIQVKEFDAITKHNQIETELSQKEIDAQHSRQSASYALADRAKELELKEKEIDSKCQLNAVEADSKIAEKEDRRRVSPDTLALVAANVLGIAMIIGYERLNVVTSKAIGFVSKLR